MCAALSRRARVDLLRARGRRSIWPAHVYEARYGNGTIFVSHDDFEIDLRSLAFVVVDEAYKTDYEDTVVVDIGAHKGYYAAYAVGRGARRLVAYEPESVNFAVLDRTAARYRQHVDWEVRRAAVGAEREWAELHVMGASWGHSLEPPSSFADYEIGRESVEVVALEDVLAEAGEHAGETQRLVVKMNIEGGECLAILGTPLDAWAGVSELFVETHPWAPCDESQLAEHLEPVGLTRTESAHPAVLRLRREAAPRFGPRTGPR